MSRSTILVTGAAGFVGQPLCATLLAKGYHLRAAVRTRVNARALDDRAARLIADVENSPSDVWRNALRGAGTLIHLAARVHDHDQTDGELFFRTNTEATARLCRLAIECGIRQFIYLSTIKVNGETSLCPLSESDSPRARGPYARSKLAAERHIEALTRGSNCRYVIIRPPLVYGPRVKANFQSLLKIVALNLPLPFGSLHNRRSMIYVGNLVDAIICAMENPQAADQVFMVSDGDDRSVADIAAGIAQALDRRPRLIPFPEWLLRCFLTLMGKRRVIDKLTQPLTLDIAKSAAVLGWRPPFSFEQGIADTVDWFVRSRCER